jgi:AcrR family transcriptional regulator
MVVMSQEPRRPGRPRDARLDGALLETALAVFLERGYHGTTFTQIARRVGVGTPAIYRRWSTKAALAIDIIVGVGEPEPIPDSGSIRDDLVAFVVLRLRTWSTPLFRQLVFPVLMEGSAEESLGVQVRQRFVGYRKALAGRILRAVGNGELRADTDPNRLVNLLMGTITMPLLFFQDVPAVDQAESIVDQVLEGFATKDRVSNDAK